MNITPIFTILFEDLINQYDKKYTINAITNNNKKFLSMINNDNYSIEFNFVNDKIKIHISSNNNIKFDLSFDDIDLNSFIAYQIFHTNKLLEIINKIITETENKSILILNATQVNL
jgi:hypothetical protein